MRDKKTAYFPFFQFRDQELIDFFCTCARSEKGCAHLSAAYTKIFGNHEEPLHLRFAYSFWNHLCRMVGARCDYEPTIDLVSETGKKLFSIEAQTDEARERLANLVAERPPETEETSLKFFNLPPEELQAWREGRASAELRYELSIWSDLAKWFVHLSEESYEIRFEPQEPLPNEGTIQFVGLLVRFYVAEAHWPELIPSLNTMASPLKRIDQGEIISVTYDSSARALRLERKEGEAAALGREGTPVGSWLYMAGKGFVQREIDAFIPAERIADFLSQSTALLEPFLSIQTAPQMVHYALGFDANAHLHIRPYFFAPGDWRGAELFAPWVYLPERGFVRCEGLLFSEKETIIAPQSMAEFINRHRHWLHSLPGFQIHVRSLESKLSYSMEGDKLRFITRVEGPESAGRRMEFEGWIYVEGEGFYAKREPRGRLPIYPGREVSRQEISLFIETHREALEEVQGFFSSQPLVGRRGLEVSVTREGRILISPSAAHEEKARLYGDFAYVEGKGFSEMAPLPEKYREAELIPIEREAAFFTYELEALKPFILSLDARLRKPSQLAFSVKQTIPIEKRAWWVEALYHSEFGEVDLATLWEGAQGRRAYLFTAAGLFSSKDARWSWLRQLPKERIDLEKRLVLLQTTEWIRLQAFEGVTPPISLEDAVPPAPFSLRPYQEEGLRWLWFLYSYSLSGLLCDDMGLGKTHQAMALLAAIAGEDVARKNRYLVVCPTSVIYHWQELLRRYLPSVRVLVYHGFARSLDSFEEGRCDLLLTSYGVARSSQEQLRSFFFTLAIYDEIQVAKNHASKVHQALRSLHSQMRLGLTGTPIENRLRELKALFDLILPTYLPSDALFREQFSIPIETQGDDRAKDLLLKLVRPFILRREKRLVLTELPEKIEQVAYCDLSEEQRTLYQNTVRQIRGTFQTEGEQPPTSLHLFSALTALKQICDHPSLIDGDLKNFQNRASGKWELFLELLHEARNSGQKVVVFSQYLGMVEIIETYLKRKGIRYASITGATRDRAAAIHQFRDDPTCEVFVASLLAAGVGIDLTAASVVIHYDRWWNPAKEQQATDRVHRIGQSRGVQVFKLVVKETIEEYIHELIERKRRLFEGIIGATEAEPITREELLEIFQRVFHGSG